ncbi:MAG: transketolase [Planctomycetes bacterium]|nr:transketolase [Planctomycetota bacterium]
MSASPAELRAMANRLRIHSIRMTTAAGSGHPTTCMSAAETAACLFFRIMRYDPSNPASSENDRFVLSKGHAAPLLYAALAEAGAIPMSDMATLRKLGSRIEGHPTPKLPWVHVATGSLGQGLSAGMGMAVAFKQLDKSSRRVYVLLGDGEVAEGAVWEAAAFAAHYGMDNVTAIVDVNRLGQSQDTMLGHDIEAHAGRFRAFGWHVITVDGHDCAALIAAFEEAQRTSGKPTALIARTVKGKGFSEVEGKNGYHGKPLTAQEAERAIAQITAAGLDPAAKPPAAKASAQKACCGCGSRAAVEPPQYKLGDKVATREAYGAALLKLGAARSDVVALDGDVKNSTFAEKFAKAYPDRYFECFIAEQNMAGVAMGLATCGRVPFASSFAAFLVRAADQVRMAGISRLNVKFVGSHAGVSIGEDGPSQMALEDLAIFRALPESVVLYPSDAVSAEKLVAAAADHKGLTFIRTSRPKTEVLYANTEEFPIGGLKVVRQSSADQLTIVGGGVTVHEALAAAKKLQDAGISARVVDLYCVKPFPTAELLRNVKQTGGRVLVVEDHYPEGGLGEATASALATAGVQVHRLAVSQLPCSATAPELLDYCGISSKQIEQKARQIVARL